MTLPVIDLNNFDTWPAIGSLWQHKNGNRYRVLMFTNIETGKQDHYPTTIVYQNVDNEKTYSRRLNDWSRSMTQIGA